MKTFLAAAFVLSTAPLLAQTDAQLDSTALAQPIARPANLSSTPRVTAPAVPSMSISFSNPGLTPSDWSLEFHPDGSGHFKSQHGNAAPRDIRLLEAPDIDRDVQLSPKFAAHAFQVAQKHKLFNTECESRAKVAFQGTKTLRYAGSEGQGSCAFNYSRDPEIQELGDSLVAVATTVVEGARLEMLLQHDRLGLDQEIQTVQDAAGDGRAQQICSIREILERLSNDPAVMERVRKRARALLARAEQ